MEKLWGHLEDLIIPLLHRVNAQVITELYSELRFKYYKSLKLVDISKFNQDSKLSKSSE